jgi:esterase/lipase superfamily enzyme
MRRLPVAPIVFGVVVVFLVGCAGTHPLMPSPSLFKESPRGAGFEDTPAALRRPDIDLLFVTDRNPETDPSRGMPYGEARSFSLAFGSAPVEFGPDLTWAELDQQSRLAERTRPVNLELGETRELGRFPRVPYALEETSAGVVRTSEVMERHREIRAQFEAELRRRLEQSPSRQVMLYVHGFNETFASGAYTAAELCHFLGRRDVCAFFTWPASATGFLLTAFTTTTESARFSVGHLKRTIRMIAQTPGVEAVQLLAHSRGAALMLDAVRELSIEAIAAGIAPADAFKIDNLVLMAPDVDKDVARKQFSPFASDPDMTSNWPSRALPRVLNGRYTIYSSPEDRALILSTRLFRSRSRVGSLSAESLDVADAQPLKIWGSVDFIILQGERTDFFGHSYFASNPEVSSDLIQLLRFGRKPGEPGRPLRRTGPVTWTFPDTND